MIQLITPAIVAGIKEALDTRGQVTFKGSEVPEVAHALLQWCDAGCISDHEYINIHFTLERD